MGALSGIRVIDFGHYYAGSLTALLLAEQGAEIIHIDRPGPSPLPPEQDALLQRSKQRLTLDLKVEADRAVALALVERADVLIENFRPGVMSRLGFDPADWVARSAQLIYCSLPGFSAQDPRRDLAGWEGIVSAAAGLYNAVSPAGALPADRSPFNALPLVSNFAAFQAATAIVMALIARARDGRGQRIEAPLFDAAIELLGPLLPDTFPNYTIINGGGIYACASGHVFFNANNPRFLFWLLGAVGRLEPWRAEGLLAPEVLTGKNADRNAELRSRLAALFKGRTAHDWEQLAAEHHIPLARMQRFEEWRTSEAARVSGAVRGVVQNDGRELLQPGAILHLSATPGGIEHAAHSLDQDRAAVLDWLKSPASSRTPPSSHPAATALEGIRVLDLSNILAAPSVGRWLADFGAEVIKLNDPRAHSVAMHDYLNRGKRSALVDITVPAGRDVALALAKQCDVFLNNFPRPTVERYGLTEETVRGINPDVIYATVSCYGALGEWRERRGYEPQAQSCTGIMNRYGSDENPVMLPYLLNDYGTGILGAFAVGLALFARTQHGIAQRAEVSLAQTATWHQWGVQTPSWYHGLYRSSDRWLFIGATAAQQTTLRELLGIPDGLPDAASIEQAASRLSMQTANHWIELLGKRGIVAMANATQREAMQVPYAVTRGVTRFDAPRLSGTLEHPGITVHCEGTPKRHGAVPTTVGADLETIFRDYGLAEQLPSLLQQGVISHSLIKRQMMG